MNLALQKYLNPKKLGVSVDAFKEGVVRLAANFGISPDNFMIIFFNESGFNPAVINSIGAVGLIQFMPATLKAWGLTNTGVSKLNALQQLGLVYNYYKPAKGKLKNVYDLYLWTFYPYAVGKPDSFIIGSEKSDKWAKEVAKDNKIFAGANGYVTVGAFKDFIKKHYGSIINKIEPGESVPNSLLQHINKTDVIYGALAVISIAALVAILKDEKK